MKLNQSIHPMRRRSKRSVSLFAVAVAAGLSAASAFAQYYPPTSPAALFPVANNPDLQVINAALNTLKPGETLGQDPVAGSAAVLPVDFTNAVAAAVVQAIKGQTPSGVTVASLTRAAALLRPSIISNMSKAIAAQIVLNAAPADQAGYIHDLTYEFSLVSGKAAPAVVSGVITTIYTVKGNTNPIDPTDVAVVTTEAIDAAPLLAGKSIAAAIGATKKTFTTATAEDNVVTAGVNAVISSGAASTLNAVATATLAAAVKSAAIGIGPAVATEVSKTFLNAAFANVSSQDASVQRAAAIQLVAGLAAGGGSTYSAAVEQGAANSQFASYKTVMDETIAGYNATITGLTAPIAASQFATYLSSTAGKPVDVDAAIAGAIAAHSKFASSILSSALQALGSDTNNTSSVSSIITAAVQASPLLAVADAKAIATFTGQGTTPGMILSAIMAGTTPDQYGLVEVSLFKGLGGVPNATTLNDVVSHAIATAESTQNSSTIGTLTYDAAKASKQSVSVVSNALAAANLATNPTEAAAILAGATAADPKNAGLIKSAADAALSGNANALALADLAASLTLSIVSPPKPPAGQPKDPLVFFEQENLALSSATTADQRLAIVYATTQANPKGTSAIVATALASAKASGSSEEAAIIAAAVAANPKAAANIHAAADTAIYVAAGTSDLFNYIGNQVIAYPTLAADIVTGATAADPGDAHIIGHAVGFADPLGAGKVVPALFSFSSLNAPKIGGGAGDPVARAAAITAGLVDGLVESHNTKLAVSLKAVVSAAVKASLNLTGIDPNFQQVGTNGSATGSVSTGPAGVITGYVSQVASPTTADATDAVLTAVLTAAAKSAKAYVLQIAQAAAEAAAYVYDTHNATPAGAGAYAGIVNSLNGVNPILTPAQIQAAVNFGIAQAQSLLGGNLAAAGAGAAGVENYTTHPVTGNFVTSILDL